MAIPKQITIGNVVTWPRHDLAIMSIYEQFWNNHVRLNMLLAHELAYTVAIDILVLACKVHLLNLT